MMMQAFEYIGIPERVSVELGEFCEGQAKCTPTFYFMYSNLEWKVCTPILLE
jgi:hypothetical protein